MVSLLDFELLIEVYAHCSRHHPASTIPILELLDKLLPMIHDRDFYRLLDRLAGFYDFESQVSDRCMRIWANLLLQCANRAEAGPWLNACWKLLRHAEKYMSRDPNHYSHETIEKLCLLSFKANRSDPTFPLDFVGEITRWVDEQIRYDCLSVAHLPIVELLDKHQYRKNNSKRYLPLERILDAYDCDDEISDQSILIFANYLLEGYAQANIESWLNNCWRLLKNAERCFFRYRVAYSDETIEKLFLLSLKANKQDRGFPLDFVYEYAMWTVEQIREVRNHITEMRRDCNLSCTYTDLLVLVMTMDVMQTSEHYQGGEGTQICESTDALLQIMCREGIRLSDVWKEKSQAVLALCHTAHEYSEEARTYVLTELTELVRAVRTELSLELYRELNTVAERFNHAELKYELTQVW